MLFKVLLFLCLSSLALCATVKKSFESCLTQVGSVSSKNVPTSRSTTTVVQADATVGITITPTTQVTPTASSTTRTVTTTVYTQSYPKGSIVTSTITFISATTTKEIRTSVVTFTSTRDATATSTVATPSGFLPAADTTASAYPKVPQYGNSTITARTSLTQSSSSTSSVSTSSRKGRLFNNVQARAAPRSYPRLVNCKFISLQIMDYRNRI